VGEHAKLPAVGCSLDVDQVYREAQKNAHGG
jgi:hypothetical protein